MIPKSMRLFMFAALAILMASACVMILEDSEEADAVSDHDIAFDLLQTIDGRYFPDEGQDSTEVSL